MHTTKRIPRTPSIRYYHSTDLVLWYLDHQDIILIGSILTQSPQSELTYRALVSVWCF